MGVKILAFAGSVRKESFNKKLIKIAVLALEKTGAEVTHIDLKDYSMPLYDQDLEVSQGLPENAKKLKELFKSHDGFIISCPEYNSSITPLVKNTLDWISRKELPNEPSLAAYHGKVAALISASPGALGGLRGLVHVRSILGNCGVMVLPNQVSIPKAAEAFTSEGTLKDSKQSDAVNSLVRELFLTANKLK